MSGNDKKLLTTVRLDVDLSKQIRQLTMSTGASQSDIIRHLIAVALGENAKLQITKTTELSTEAKALLFSLSNNLSNISTELAKIGANINIRRKKYNVQRKELSDKIYFLQKQLLSDDVYTQIKHAEKIQSLRIQLEQFDEKSTKFVAKKEWNQFEKILSEFNKISYKIGGALNDIYN